MTLASRSGLENQSIGVPVSFMLSPYEHEYLTRPEGSRCLMAFFFFCPSSTIGSDDSQPTPVHGGRRWDDFDGSSGAVSNASPSSAGRGTIRARRSSHS